MGDWALENSNLGFSEEERVLVLSCWSGHIYLSISKLLHNSWVSYLEHLIFEHKPEKERLSYDVGTNLLESDTVLLALSCCLLGSIAKIQISWP